MRLYTFLISNPAALLMFLIIQTAQAIHTSYVLYKITALPYHAAMAYSILAAIGIELIIVSLVGRGRVGTASAYKWFYFTMNAFAYHLSPEIYFIDPAKIIEGYPIWLSLNAVGFFVLIPAYFLPLAGEELAKELTREDPTTTKPKKKRRTNAEIEADNKKKQIRSNPDILKTIDNIEEKLK